MPRDRVPGLRPQSELVDRPDNTTSIVGRRGIPVQQDTEGTQIQRLGIAGANADWGPATVDITDNSPDGTKIADPERVGGTNTSSGLLRSVDGNPFSVVYVWEDEDSVVDTITEAENSANAIIERPDNLQSDTLNLAENVTTKSDYCSVFLVDESADGTANSVEFTLNFH